MAVRWIGLLLIEGQFFLLGTASLTVLGHELNNRELPACRSALEPCPRELFPERIVKAIGLFSRARQQLEIA